MVYEKAVKLANFREIKQEITRQTVTDISIVSAQGQ